MTVLIECRAVGRVYPGTPPVTAVMDVSLVVNSHDVVVLTGPSGSGKSTLLGVLGLLDQPTSGTVSIAGHRVQGLGDRQRTSLRQTALGFVFQRFHLLPHLTAVQNVELGLRFRGLSNAARKAAAQEALRTVSLLDRATHRPAQLSGGEQQRVAIARAIAHGPKILLADEPTGNLDHATARPVLQALVAFAERGGATVLATHDPAVVAMGNRSVALCDGYATEFA